MELTFNEGTFVSSSGELNYREVLNDFPTAKTIKILTYNISKNQRQDNLLAALKNTNADIQLITNVPSRMPSYFNTPAGERMRSSARDNIRIYVSKLNPDNFPSQFTPFFNVHNHAKIIGTENIVYIGSANYSNESVKSIETGVLIKDKDFIKKLYEEFFESVKNESISYFDEYFTAFQLFIFSLHAKFSNHYHRMLTELYTNEHRTKYVVADSVFLDVEDLSTIYRDLDELDSICHVADDTYDENNEEYNCELEQLKQKLSGLSVDWLKEIISEDGSLFRLINFNVEGTANDLLENKYSFCAFDENLDVYAEKSLDEAMERYLALHNAFSEEATEFLSEFEKILATLEAAVDFTNRWKNKKINPEIDNT